MGGRKSVPTKPLKETHHPLRLCASGMSGFTAMVVELIQDRVTPLNSEVLTPLIARIGLLVPSNPSACPTHTIKKREQNVRMIIWNLFIVTNLSFPNGTDYTATRLVH